MEEILHYYISKGILLLSDLLHVNVVCAIDSSCPYDCRPTNIRQKPSVIPQKTPSVWKHGSCRVMSTVAITDKHGVCAKTVQIRS